MSEPSPAAEGARAHEGARAAEGALAGLRVVVLGEGLAPSLIGMMLAEQGAEVARVRERARPPVDPVLEAMLARGSVEVELELAREEGRAALARLVRVADVLLEDCPAGRLGELGLDPEAIRAAGNPGLVDASIAPFPAGDPRAALPAHEALVGMAGFLYEKPLGPPRYHELPIGSLLAGLFAACGVAIDDQQVGVQCFQPFGAACSRRSSRASGPAAASGSRPPSTTRTSSRRSSRS